MALTILIAPTGLRRYILTTGDTNWFNFGTENRNFSVEEFMNAWLLFRLSRKSLQLSSSLKIRGVWKRWVDITIDRDEILYGAHYDEDEVLGDSDYVTTSDGTFEIVPVLRKSGRRRKYTSTPGYRPYRTNAHGIRPTDAVPSPFCLVGGGYAVQRLLEMERLLAGLASDMAAEHVHFEQNTR